MLFRSQSNAKASGEGTENEKSSQDSMKKNEAELKKSSVEIASNKTTNDSLSEREKQLVEREEFLKKQSEYYEKVILELKEKMADQAKLNKEGLNKNEASFKEKLAKKDSEISALQKELHTWKDARAELFRGLYEKMDSKKAAKILEAMDTDLSNKILAGMKQDKAAEIMSKMAPDKAKVITEKTFSDREIGSLSNKVNTSQTAANVK